jgi:hypothetical protein
MELRNQLPGSHPLTAPVHPPERVTGPPELHHSEGRYLYLRRNDGTRRCLELSWENWMPCCIACSWKAAATGICSLIRCEYRSSRSRFGEWAVQGRIRRPWDFRPAKRAIGGASTSPSERPIGSVTAPLTGQRYRCREIGSWSRAQELLRQGHTYLDGADDGEACESLR